MQHFDKKNCQQDIFIKILPSKHFYKKTTIHFYSKNYQQHIFMNESTNKTFL